MRPKRIKTLHYALSYVITKAKHTLSHTHTHTRTHTQSHTPSICSRNKLEQVSKRVEYPCSQAEGCKTHSWNHFNGTFCICISYWERAGRGVEWRGGEGRDQSAAWFNKFHRNHGTSETIKCINTQSTQGTTHNRRGQGAVAWHARGGCHGK